MSLSDERNHSRLMIMPHEKVYALYGRFGFAVITQDQAAFADQMPF